jgi:hypothetical protein
MVARLWRSFDDRPVGRHHVAQMTRSITCITLLCVALLWASSPVPAQTTRYFPMAVWYGGGKARARMVERDARKKKELWKKDVRQIKARVQHRPGVDRLGIR